MYRYSTVLKHINTTVRETFSNGQPLSWSNDFVINQIFNTFYEDCVEFNHYVNEIIKSVSPNSELLTRLSNGNNSQKTKIKSLEKEMKNVKNENITLGENILTQRKIIEIYQVITKEKWQTLPSKIRKSKVMTLT